MINIFNPANSADISDYTSNGQATLIPTSAVLTIEINGVWQLLMEHPYDREGRYKYIKRDAILKVSNLPIREQISEYQLFRIFDTQEGIDSVSCVAFPVGMEASYDAPIQELDISKKSGVNAIGDIMSALTAEGISKYTVSTNITKQRRASYSNTNLIAVLNGTDENSFTNVWGGEVCYDNYSILVQKKLGSQSGNVRVEYGKNLTGLNYEVDTSNIITKIYPISADGIRYKETVEGATNYIETERTNTYPYAHTTFISTDHVLVNFDRDSKTDTAELTCDFYDGIYDNVYDALQSWWSDTIIVSNSESEYFVKDILKDGLTEDIQARIKMIVETETGSDMNADIQEVMDKAIEEGMKWLESAEVKEWEWHGEGTSASPYWYGSTDKRAISQYVYLDRTWKWFDSNGNTDAKNDIDEDFAWYKIKSGTNKNKRRYGTRDRYYLKNQYIYIMESGTLKEYWLDSDGWYDEDKSGDSDWSWHGSGTAADPYWFGEEGATASDDNKYAHDQWVYYANSASSSDIKYGFYWFDSDGYYYEGNEIDDDHNMDWVKTDERWWFGKADSNNKAVTEYRAVYLTNQWAKIDGEWHKFDSNGYEIPSDDLYDDYASDIMGEINPSDGLTDYIVDKIDDFYAQLYNDMEEYCKNCFDEGIDLPLVNITVNMVDLSKTTEYAEYADLEKVYLGDKVKVVDSIHDRNLTERIVGLKYDLLKKYNTEVSIGSPNKTAAEKIGLDGGRQITGRIEVEQETRGLRRAATRDAQIEDIEASKTTKKLKNKDKYVAGKGIKIVNNVISATGSGGSGGSGGGKGLQYWTETQNEIYQKQTNNIDGWTADSGCIISNTETVQWYKQFENGIWYDGRQYWAPTEFKLYKVTNGKAVIGWYKLLTGTNLALDGTKEPVYLACMYLSDDPTDVAFHKYGARYNQQGELVEWVDKGISSSSGHVEYLGITWYYSFFTGTAGVWGSEGTEYQAEEASQITNLCLNVSYQDTYAEQADRENIAIKILQASNVRISSKTKTGVAVNSAYTFYSGEKMGTESEVEEVDYTFKVSKDGDVYGKEFWLNDNETPISEQIANKQDKLTAGSNINISSSNVISATDTTYNPFGGASSTVAGTQGLVPAPTTSDYEKYLCGDGTWKAVSGGGGSLSAVELSTLEYSQLTTEQKHDATKIYFVNDNGESPKLMYKDVNYTGSGGGGGDILEANDGLYTASAGADIGMEVVIE